MPDSEARLQHQVSTRRGAFRTSSGWPALAPSRWNSTGATSPIGRGVREYQHQFPTFAGMQSIQVSGMLLCLFCSWEQASAKQMKRKQPRECSRTLVRTVHGELRIRRPLCRSSTSCPVREAGSWQDGRTATRTYTCALPAGTSARIVSCASSAGMGSGGKSSAPSFVSASCATEKTPILSTDVEPLAPPPGWWKSGRARRRGQPRARLVEALALLSAISTRRLLRIAVAEERDVSRAHVALRASPLFPIFSHSSFSAQCRLRWSTVLILQAAAELLIVLPLLLITSEKPMLRVPAVKRAP